MFFYLSFSVFLGHYHMQMWHFFLSLTIQRHIKNIPLSLDTPYTVLCSLWLWWNIAPEMPNTLFPYSLLKLELFDVGDFDKNHFGHLKKRFNIRSKYLCCNFVLSLKKGLQSTLIGRTSGSFLEIFRILNFIFRNKCGALLHTSQVSPFSFYSPCFILETF